MKIHFDRFARIRENFKFDFSHKSPCGAYSKHGLSVTNIQADVTCEKCLETLNERR